MGRLGNILDPPQTTLTPFLFQDGGLPQPILRPQIKRWLEETIREELDKYHPDSEKWASLVLTGSLTTFQYSDASDVDVSVFVTPNFMPEFDRARLIGMVVHNLDGTKVAGCPYPLQVYIVSPKITKEMLYQPGLRSGYDIDTDTWIIPPEPNRVHDVQKEYNAFYVKAMEVLDKLHSLIKHNPIRAKEYYTYLHDCAEERKCRAEGILLLATSYSR